MLIVAARLRGTEGLASLGCSWGKLGIRGKITCLKMGGQRGVLTPISSVPALCFSLNKCTIVKKTLCACMKELCCAVGSQKCWCSPGTRQRVFTRLFFLEVCSGWKNQKGLSSGLTAVGCFLHVVGKKKKVIRRFGKCLFWACICLERPITECESVLCSAVMAKYGL